MLKLKIIFSKCIGMQVKIHFCFLIIYLSIGLISTIEAQTLKLSISLRDTKQRPMANTEVTMVEMFTRKIVKERTDGRGSVHFTLTEGQLWQMNILEVQNYYMWQFPMPRAGVTSTQSRTLTYQPDKFLRDMLPPFDREALNLQEIRQNNNAKTRFTRTESLVQLVVRNSKGSPLQKYPLRLTAIEQGKCYLAETDKSGTAYFLLPPNTTYDLDMEGVERFKYVEVPPRIGAIRQTLTFEPYPYQDLQKGDTIFQNLPENLKMGTSTRMLTTFRLSSEASGGLAANQIFYLKDLSSGQFYYAQSNAEGIAQLMLPHKRKYGILTRKIGELEQYEEVLDLTRAFGIGAVEKNLYLPEVAQINLPPTMRVVQPQSHQDLQQFLQNTGLEIIDFQNKSIPYYAENFLLYQDAQNSFGIKQGFLLTSGSVWNAFGPNDSPNKSFAAAHYSSKDKIPAALAYNDEPSYDPCILEITCRAKGQTLNLDYVFASEEYSEYNDYDDAFGIFIEGEGYDPEQNLALMPDGKTRVSVTQINNSQNSNFFTENQENIWQYDGFTKKMSRQLKVKPNQIYKIKLIILDRRDAIYDSAVFVGLSCK